MSSCLPLNCSDALTVPPLLEPNPDVSGIGVLVGFFVTAYLSLILLVIHYVLVFDPAEAGLTSETRQENAIDRKILKFIAKWITRPQKTWEKALEKMVIMMSDQQMVTGIALLSSAMTQLRCNLSAYHWQITIYLVWFSSFTHLATLTVLRGYLRKNSPMRWWRLFFMTAQVGLLVAALTPTGNGNWLPMYKPEMAGMPAICLFDYSYSDSGSDAWSNMLFSMLVLCISYTTRAVKLFVWSSKVSRRVFRTIPGTAIKGHLQKLYAGRKTIKANKWIFSFPYYIILSVFLVLRSYVEILESMFREMTWLLIALLWGTLGLFATRNATMNHNNNVLEENSWGFGQCLATAMLVLILCFGVETYIETKQLTRVDPQIPTSPNGNSSNDHVGGIDKRTTSHSRPTNSSNNNFETPGTTSALTAVGDADITTQAVVAIGTDEQMPRATHSPKSPSRGERSLETVTRLEIAIRRSNSDVELNETSRIILAAPPPTDKLRHLPPRERDYYDIQWYRNLAIFNFGQVMFLSAGILSGAYSIDSQADRFTGFFGSGRDVGFMFLNIINWFFLYAPLSSFIITICYLCVTELRIERRGWFKVGDYFLFLGVTVFTIMTSGQFILPWEDLLPGDRQLFAIWFYGIFLCAYVLWYWIILCELHRQNKISTEINAEMGI